MALGSGHRNIGELFATARTAEHQPAAAHISPTGKFGGEEKALANAIEPYLARPFAFCSALARSSDRER